MSGIARTIGSLSTPFKLFLAIGLALLPIGALIVWTTVAELNETRRALRGAAQGEMITAARSVESLIGRNTLALRVAAFGAVSSGDADPCAAAREALSVTPAVERDFVIATPENEQLCGDLALGNAEPDERVGVGGIALWLDPEADGLFLRVGIPGAIATGKIDRSEFAEAIDAEAPGVETFIIDDGERTLEVMLDREPARPGAREEDLTIAMAGQRLSARASANFIDVTNRDRLNIFLPVLMWALAAILSWILVHVLLIRPLRKLNHAVRHYDVDSGEFTEPARLGPAREIKHLSKSFSDTVSRIEEGEKELLAAFEGQRRLVREVHHRVKNNLQVVASLLNIHSRGAHGKEAQAAYAGIGRRVEALAVVHRNHFAEIEETRGIQLRPLMTDLASSLRASAPNGTMGGFELDLDTAATTQDAAVSAAFFITEVVEHALARDADQSIELSLRRTSVLTARLAVSSEALVGNGDEDGVHTQFERIIEGLSRQLRSPLEKKLGSYAVELPVFPEDTDT